MLNHSVAGCYLKSKKGFKKRHAKGIKIYLGEYKKNY